MENLKISTIVLSIVTALLLTAILAILYLVFFFSPPPQTIPNLDNLGTEYIEKQSIPIVLKVNVMINFSGKPKLSDDIVNIAGYYLERGKFIQYGNCEDDESDCLLRYSCDYSQDDTSLCRFYLVEKDTSSPNEELFKDFEKSDYNFRN